MVKFTMVASQSGWQVIQYARMQKRSLQRDIITNELLKIEKGRDTALVFCMQICYGILSEHNPNWKDLCLQDFYEFCRTHSRSKKDCLNQKSTTRTASQS